MKTTESVSQSREIWHVGTLLSEGIASLIGGLEASVHLSLSGSHLGLGLFDGLDMSIILFLLDWFSGLSWLISHPLLLHLNLLLDSGLSSLELHLHLSGLHLGLGNGGDVLSVFVDGWVFSGLLLCLLLLLLGELGEMNSLLSSGHLCEGLLVWEELRSGHSDGGGLVDIWGVCNFLLDSLAWGSIGSGLGLSLGLSLSSNFCLSCGEGLSINTSTSTSGSCSSSSSGSLLLSSNFGLSLSLSLCLNRSLGRGIDLGGGSSGDGGSSFWGGSGGGTSSSSGGSLGSDLSLGLSLSLCLGLGKNGWINLGFFSCSLDSGISGWFFFVTHGCVHGIDKFWILHDHLELAGLQIIKGF